MLTGSERRFSAGVDLRAILDGGPDYTGRFLESLVAGFLAVFDYPAPVDGCPFAPMGDSAMRGCSRPT